MFKNFIFCLLILSFTVSSCSDNDMEESIEIRYGTSFGFCVGYCNHNMVLKPDLVTYSKGGWNNSVATIICSESLDNDGWNSFKDFPNLDAFFDLPEFIGCPDCADGGSEWLEIKLANGEKHKVTFEYSNEPDVLKDYIALLRTQLEKAEDCK